MQTRPDLFSPRALLAAMVALATWATDAAADVRLPAIFGDAMVLQRGREVPVWGWASPGERVTVECAGQQVTSVADRKGRWSLFLKEMRPGGPHTFTVRGENEIVLQDVLVGEVWICSGQSNMEWPLGRARDADLEVAAVDHPRIRLLTVPHRPIEEPQDEFVGSWKPCSPETARDFSAVGYFFGRRLHQELGVPIGLIDSSYGGTPAEAWTSVEALKREVALRPLMERWQKDVDGEKRKPEGKMRTHPHRPGNLFNGMVAPLIPYAIRGAIWYQGESNASRAVQYGTIFPAMIRDWRRRWVQGNFPFYFVQLANFQARKPEPAESPWAELRETQRLTLEALPNTGMAVIIDIGEAKDIHPRNKQDVGLRLAAWALAKDYGRLVPFSGPLYRSMKREGRKVVLSFEHVEGGLDTSDGQAPRGFAVAGRGRKFLWAQAEIVGNTLVVWHPQIPRVYAVRYAWADNPDCNLVNGAGFPASPFRTDDWPLTTAGKH